MNRRKQSVTRGWGALLAIGVALWSGCGDSAAKAIRRGDHCLDKGDCAAAVSCFSAAIDQSPNYAAAYAQRGLAHHRSGDYDKAIADYRKALELAPDVAATYNRRGTAFASIAVQEQTAGHAVASTANWERAAADFRQSIALDPASAATCHNLAFALAASGQASEAVRTYREVLRLKPDHGAALNELAWILATNKDPAVRDGADAVRLAEKLCDCAGRQSPRILDTLAASYAEAGRYNDAVQAAQEALHLANEFHIDAIAALIRARAECYQSGKPYRESP